ncbi:MAG: redox-regulated ATPase YchF, partial [bacterium]
MQIGIVGLSLSGKTTLFNALTGQQESTGFYAGKREKHVAVVKVPDKRLDNLHELAPQARKVHTTIEYIDMAGVERGSVPNKSGFDAQFLGDLRQTDALLVVVRAFENDAVPHPDGSVDAHRDYSAISDEFLLSDLVIVENRLSRIEQQIRKAKNDAMERELALLKSCHARLEEGKPLREMDLTVAEEMLLRGFQFLSIKPTLVAVNISESDIVRAEEIENEFRSRYPTVRTDFIAFSAEIEMEIAQLSEDDAALFLQEMSIKEPALTRMIRYSHNLLGLLTFFTYGENEVRSWTLKKGMTARMAAGEIHSDMERGFIRAETTNYETLLQHKSLAKCRETGALRLEGKEYIVKDGDVI